MLAGDLDGLGKAMCDNTAAQADLHPGLVSLEARRIIDVARAHAAAGWKVNGAGGEGGSITLLGASNKDTRDAMLHAIAGESPALQIIPIDISRAGLRVWEADSVTPANSTDRDA